MQYPNWFPEYEYDRCYPDPHKHLSTSNRTNIEYERKCKKCGSKDLYIKYVPKRTITELVYDYNKDRFSDKPRGTDEFSMFMKDCISEHLDCTCRTCQYKWTENTLDNMLG